MHQLGRDTDATDVASLLHMLLRDSDFECSVVAARTLAELNVDDVGLMNLWAAVCEEFGDPWLGTELDQGSLSLDMTVETAAAAMTGLLARGRHGC